jgi:Zn-dependent alcohol dehydrogenase
MSEQFVIVGAGGIGLSLYYLCMSLDVRAVCVDVAAVVDKIRLKDADVTCACIDEARVKYEHSCSTVIVCSGHLSAFELGESLLMRNSGSLILVGNPPNGHKVPFDVKPILYGRKIVGVGEKDLKLPEDMYELINLVNRGRLNMDKVIQASYHINDLGEAFSRVEAGVGGKTLIKMN